MPPTLGNNDNDNAPAEETIAEMEEVTTAQPAIVAGLITNPIEHWRSINYRKRKIGERGPDRTQPIRVRHCKICGKVYGCGLDKCPGGGDRTRCWMYVAPNDPEY